MSGLANNPTLTPLPDAHAPGLHPAVAAVAAWVTDFLAAPNDDLGRSGSVCPFIAPALTRDSIYLACEPGDPDLDWGVEQMRAYRRVFAQRAARAGHELIFVAALVLFPDLPESRYGVFVEGVQVTLKCEFMREGMMIGEFHPGPPPRPGLWSPDFRPFKSPVPLLAIRRMVAADFPFVKDSAEQLEIYLERFADEMPPRLVDQLATHPASRS